MIDHLADIQLILPVTVLTRAPVLISILQIVIFFLPVIFQLVIGLKALRGKIRLRFWVVCLISIFGQILSTVLLLLTMANILKQAGSHDGLGYMFVVFLGVFLIAIILIVIGTQLIIRRMK